MDSSTRSTRRRHDSGDHHYDLHDTIHGSSSAGPSSTIVKPNFSVDLEVDATMAAPRYQPPPPGTLMILPLPWLTSRASTISPISTLKTTPARTPASSTSRCHRSHCGFRCLDAKTRFFHTIVLKLFRNSLEGGCSVLVTRHLLYTITHSFYINCYPSFAASLLLPIIPYDTVVTCLQHAAACCASPSVCLSFRIT